MMIADTGVIIRTHVADISTYSRVSQGVRIMKLKNNAKIVSVALAKREDYEESLEENQEVENEENTEVNNTEENIEETLAENDSNNDNIDE